MFSIRDRRTQLNMTIKELAEKVGVTEATVSRWETGDIATVKHKYVQPLADALHVSPLELIGSRPDLSKVSEEDIKYALFDGADNVTDEMFEEVKQFARFVAEKNKKK